MKYVPHHELKGAAHLMIDGSAQEGTAMVLSHWPKSGTPWPLKADLSAQIVFKYLKDPKFHVKAEAATNNHFDTDGLVGIYAALEPETALKKQALLEDVACAGDFQTFFDEEAFHISTALEAYADPERSPLPSATFQGSFPERCGATYEALLKLLPEVLAEPGKFKGYWENEAVRLKQTEELVHSGKVLLKEDEGLDLAVFSIPEGVKESQLSPYALHRFAARPAVLMMWPRNFRFYYRYESWVQFVSRKLRPRVDLRPLAERLTGLENGEGRWEAEAPDQAAPTLKLSGAKESRIHAEAFERMLKSAMATGKPAHDPFDPR